MKDLKRKLIDKYISLKEKYDYWYRTTDFAQAGHDTARFIKKTLYYSCSILLTILFWASVLYMGWYILVQFELLTNFRPEWVDNLIKSTDKTTLPILFRDNQGHPFVLFMIWVTCIVGFFHSLGAAIKSWGLAKYNYLVGIFYANTDNVLTYCMTWFILTNMNNPQLYILYLKYIIFFALASKFMPVALMYIRYMIGDSAEQIYDNIANDDRYNDYEDDADYSYSNSNSYNNYNSGAQSTYEEPRVSYTESRHEEPPKYTYKEPERHVVVKYIRVRQVLPNATLAEYAEFVNGQRGSGGTRSFQGNLVNWSESMVTTNCNGFVRTFDINGHVISQYKE